MRENAMLVAEQSLTQQYSILTFTELDSGSESSDSINQQTMLSLEPNMMVPTIFFIYTNPSAQARYDTRSIFKRNLMGSNSKLSFSKTSCLTKAEEHSLPYYLPIAGGRIIIGFIPFPGILVLCEMQSVSSRIWTRIAVSISYDDNHYITDATWRWLWYIYIYMMIMIYIYIICKCIDYW